MRAIAYVLAVAVPVIGIPMSPAVAQTAPAHAAWVGKTVLDPKEGKVGVVSAVRDGNVIVKTDRLEATLPATSFTYQQNKLYFGMTQVELNAAIEKAAADREAALAAALQPGAAVKGSAGTVLGTIEQVDDEYVALKLASGKIVRIPRSGIAATVDGAIAGVSAAELEAQLATAQ